MRRLRNPSVTPPEPEYFTYVHEENGHRTTHIQHAAWIEQAIAHRMANGLNVPADFVSQMENQLCQKLSPDWCEFEKDGTTKWTNTRLSLSDIIGFTKVLLAHVKDGGFVSQEEADRRAKICASCYLNVHVSGCGACHALTSVLTPNRSTKYDNQLQSCGVCRCYNRSQVHFPLTTLEANDTIEKQSTYPSHCWKSKSSVNYFPDEQANIP